MSIFTSLQNFLIYLRLHKGRSRKTQEQYVFHIWRFICYMIPELDKMYPNSPTTFLPPSDKEIVKTWKSPLIELSKLYNEPIIEDIKKRILVVGDFHLQIVDSQSKQ